ncbi:MAG: hypothetical protein ACJ76I_12055 [Gaiellaceae bacterium]
MTESYLLFALNAEASAGRKTEVWHVCAARDGSRLGVIKWFGRWRQYAFFPEPGTVFNPECLDAINEQIRTLMRRRRAA